MWSQIVKLTARKLIKGWHFVQRNQEPHRTFWLLNETLPKCPHNLAGRVVILGWDIEYFDARTLSEMIKLQVHRKYNDFCSSNPNPRILDCGSNIGVSVLRYKQLYPKARITCFEPDYALCKLLRSNLLRNGAPDVEVVEAAVWTDNELRSFESLSNDDSQGGHLLLESEPSSTTNGSLQIVKTVRLSDYLDEPVDFVKLDIEGAELEVLESCTERFSNIKQMLIEVHYHVDRADVLARILDILYRGNFRVAVQQFTSIKSWKPFERNPLTIADQFPVIWAWRDLAK